MHYSSQFPQHDTLITDNNKWNLNNLINESSCQKESVVVVYWWHLLDPLFFKCNTCNNITLNSDNDALKIKLISIQTRTNWTQNVLPKSLRTLGISQDNAKLDLQRRSKITLCPFSFCLAHFFCPGVLFSLVFRQRKGREPFRYRHWQTYQRIVSYSFCPSITAIILAVYSKAAYPEVRKGLIECVE